MFVTAGELNRRGTLQSAALSQAQTGEPVATWTTRATVWCEVKPVTPRSVEFARSFARSFAQTVDHVVRMRFRDDVRQGWRVVVGDRIFQIVGIVDEDGRREMLACYCMEIVA